MAADDVEEEEFESSTRQKKKPTKEEEKRLLRKKKLLPGSLMKGIIRSGEEAFGNPKDGDQVIIHWAIRTVEGALVQSTRSEHGGKGTPIRYVLGKSNMLLGLSEGIPTMVKGEVAMFKMKPEVHYGEVDCPVTIPEDFPKEAELHFEIELLDFFKVKVINEDLGVVKRIIDEGRGWETPREPYEVKARITARSVDGRLILKQTQEPFFLTMGKGEVPKGVEMGMGTMTKGEKAVIYISSPYLTPSPFMTLTEEEMQFEVDLLHFIQVRDMLGDGRLIKRRIVDGRGDFPMDCPLQDSLLRVHYKGMLLDEERTVFYSTKTDNDGQPLEFSSGEGLVPEGLEMCVRLMLPGEVALLTCPPDYAYDKFTRGRPTGVPEGAHVQWEIELLGFEMPKDWTGLSFQEIMDEADKIKYTGNRLFKEGKFELAKAKYEKVLRDYNHVNPQDDEEGKIFLNSRNSLHLNVAACYQKMGEYKKSTEACNKVLDGSPAHVKALYRRGMSHMLAGYFDEARTDFKMMITVDKSSEADATAALLKLKQKEQDAEKKARKQFKGLFDKKPGEISDVGSEDRNQVKETDKGEAAVEQENHNSEMLDDDRDQEPEKIGLFSRLWPTSRRIFTSLGIHRCTIL